MKTSAYINNNSEKYVQRTSRGQTKSGTAGVSDAAHIFSFGLANTILTHSGGRPMSNSTRQDFIGEMNHSSNLRIKSSYGNKVLDERRDARIAHAFVNDEPIKGASTATRAYNAYKAANNMNSVDSLAESLGNMRVYDESTGRSHKLSNHDKYQ